MWQLEWLTVQQQEDWLRWEYTVGKPTESSVAPRALFAVVDGITLRKVHERRGPMYKIHFPAAKDETTQVRLFLVLERTDN